MLTVVQVQERRLFKSVRHLYKEAFPLHEQVPFSLLKLASRRGLLTMLAFLQNDTLVGIAFIASSDTLVYVNYLAVKKDRRGEGLGSEILSYLKHTYSQDLVLIVESTSCFSLNRKERKERIAFYEKNGFMKTNDLMKEMGSLYTILSTDKDFKISAFNRLLKSLTFLQPPYRLYKEN